MESFKEKIPFNCIISGPTCCGKTQFLIEQLVENFRFCFEYIILICPTFKNNKTYNKKFVFKDPRFIILSPEANPEEEINELLKCCRILFSGTKTLLILDDCASSKDFKKQSNEFVNLAFSARHDKISVWVLTQKLCSISKPFRNNIKCLVAFYSPSKSENETFFDEFCSDISREERDKIKNVLKNEKFSKIILSLFPPFHYCVEIPSFSSKIFKS